MNGHPTVANGRCHHLDCGELAIVFVTATPRPRAGEDLVSCAAGFCLEHAFDGAADQIVRSCLLANRLLEGGPEDQDFVARLREHVV